MTLLNGSFHIGPSRIGLGIAVLARGEAEGQYSHPKARTTGRGPVTGPL